MGTYKLSMATFSSLATISLRNLAFIILGLLCKSQLRFDSCDITFTSNKRILIDWLIDFNLYKKEQ